MIQVQTSAYNQLGHERLSVDIYHNETLLTLSGYSQVDKIDLSKVGLG